MKKSKIKESTHRLIDCPSSTIAIPVAMDGEFNLKINRELNEKFVNLRDTYDRLITHKVLKLGESFKVLCWIRGGGYKEIVFLPIYKKETDKLKPTLFKKSLNHFKRTYRERAITSITFDLKLFPLLKGDEKKIQKLIEEELGELLIEKLYLYSEEV